MMDLKYADVLIILSFCSDKLRNLVLGLEAAKGIKNGDVALIYANGESVNLELTQSNDAYLRAAFSDKPLADKNSYFSKNVCKLLLEKALDSKAKVCVHIGCTEQPGELVKSFLTEDAMVDARSVLAEELYDAIAKVNTNLNKGNLSYSIVQDLETRLQKLQQQDTKLSHVNFKEVLNKSTITTSYDFKDE